MGECNPACQKIIRNSGLLATAAHLLAGTRAAGDAIRAAAIELRDAARATLAVYDHLVGNRAIKAALKPAKWAGCAEASEVMAMVAAINTPGFDPSTETTFANRLNELRNAEVDHAARMITGEMP